MVISDPKYSYLWREGRRYPVSAQVAGEFVEGLTKKNGEVTPGQLLDASRSEKAPLHPCFEWDDQKAAEGYRKDQARELLNNLVVVKVLQTSNPEDNKPRRAFVNVREGNSPSVFKVYSVAMSNKYEREIVLMNARNRLSSARRELSEIDGFEPECEVISGVEERLKNAQNFLPSPIAGAQTASTGAV